MDSFTVLLRHGARNLDAYRPASLAGPEGWRLARRLLERQRQALGLDTFEPLGEGALGWVFAARQPSLGRRVAVKLGKQVASEVGDDPLWRQAHAMARLAHPGVPVVFGCGRLGGDGPGYLLLEWIEGESLDRWLARAPGAPGADACVRRMAVAVEVAEALAHGHERGVVHGDVKPANILVPADPRRPAVLVDWSGHSIADPADPHGQRRLTLATIDYMPPERLGRATPEPVPTDDLWALAVVVHRALVGPSPIEPGDASLRQLPPGIAATLAAALANDPAQRPRTACELLAGLRRGLAELRARVDGDADAAAGDRGLAPEETH